ncbi:uncharacterized protein TNCV_4237491 [Trichonephila clavipes]|nr:uncharacterized protein TNCV_4237491 [Trichonephila clavipes]
MGSPHTGTFVITAEIDSGFVAKDDLVSFRCSPVSSHPSPPTPHSSMGGCKGSTCNGRRDPKCPSARRHRMVQEDTGDPSEGATCAWMMANEAIGCTRAFFTMWWSSRRLVCRGRPEPGLSVNDIFQIHWLQNFLITQTERPN